ncbi:MAG: 2OG-Fe(II) oxygenase [Alphaproteobacteria bacterium]|nr:2OG-Fe(II) oxygenase [Alphaproteobacteria bacterium]
MDSRLVTLFEAAKAGNPQALTHLAHVQAMGVYTARNFGAALENLTRAAAVDWPDAKRELQVLARATRGSWKQLRGAVNAETLRRPPTRRVALEQPRVRVFEGFATEAECDWLIERGRGSLGPAKVYEDSGTELKSNAGRSNSEAGYDLEAADLVLSVVHDRIARASGVPVEHFEVAKLLQYKPGQTFARHSDFLQPGMQEYIDTFGQRVATFLVYLSDDYDGGETEFTEANFKFKARKGDALMFMNVDAKGEPDPMSMHAGLPPTRGEKWVLSQWLRAKPVNAYQTPNVMDASLPPEWYRDA